MIIINFSLLMLWVLMLKFAHDWVYNIHSWLGFKNLSVEKFDEIHYQSIAYFKLTVYIFNLVPYLALVLLGE